MGKRARFASLLALLAAVSLGGCARVPVPRIPGVYKLDIQQGNVITEDMLARLRPDMEKRKVRFLLGTPIIVDSFNPDRWNYLYTLQKGGHEREQRHIVVVFENDRLVSVEGDVVSALTRKNPEHLEQVVTVPDQDHGTIFGKITKVIRGDNSKPEEPQSEESFFARVFGGGDATQPGSQEGDKEESGVAGTAAAEGAVEPGEAQEPNQESGMFSKLKNVFQSDTAPADENEPAQALLPESGIEETDLEDAEPLPPADEDTQASASEEPAGEESPSFFTRLKQRFSGDEETPDNGETADSAGAVSGEDAAAGDQPEGADDGFFARLKRRFSSEEPSAEPAAEASVEDSEPEAGFFKRLSTRFGLGEAAPAPPPEQEGTE